MAPPCFCFLLVTVCLFSLARTTAEETIYPFQYIYQIGDSISDTGNLIRESAAGADSPAARLPYGCSIGGPTGRWSDGLLIIDFIATSLSLPLLNPYLEVDASFDHGANFAVAGSTALDSSFLAARGIQCNDNNRPISVQLNWFKSHLNSTCHIPAGCQKRLSRALVWVGEIGGNDINYSILQGKSIEEIETYVPYIVEAITNVVREVISLGAVQIVVPGNFPSGCFPACLALFPNGDATAYDEMGCLRNFNELANFQNNHLLKALTLLRVEFPHVLILYADYYTAFQTLLHRAPYLGFEQKSLLKACCGIYGNLTCGSPGAPVCSNPAQHIHWDGAHLTQEAYRRISEILINDILSTSKDVW